MTTDITAEDALHFRGETLTPESPRPVHFAEPHNIPVLENQINPEFNDTAAHEKSLDAKGDELPNIASEVEDPTHLTKQLFSRTIELFRDGTNTLGSGASGGQQDTGSLPSGPGCKDTGSKKSTMPVDNVNGNARDLSASSLPDNNGQRDVVPNGAPSSLAPDSNSLSSSLPSDTPSLTASHTPNQPPAELDASHSTRAEPTANDQAAEKNGGFFDDGEVNFQNLLDNLSQPVTTAPHMAGDSASTLSPVNDTPMIESSLPSGLPPRPPPQEKPSIHPNYLPTDDIRSFHPASAQLPSHYPASNPHQPAALSPIIESSAAAPGTTLVPSELPPPPVAAFQQSHSGFSPPTAKAALQNGKQDKIPNHLERGDEAPWPPEVQKKYDEFLQQERVHVTEGLWDRFPQGSRLFVGNLPSERVTKRDLFHLFHKYGTLAQISIKQAYGFVQFADASSCRKALEAEQGGILRGRKIHLEISKPQRNTRPAPSESQRAPVRRSRSPDYDRGSRRSSFDRPEPGRPQFSNFRDRDRTERRRGDYRPPRSPSPRGARRDEFRSRDRSIERDRRRRRSRSPYARERYRTPSPRGARGRDRVSDLDLPIPKRSPRSVPDVQLIVLENVDREFVYRVERAFRDRGLRSDVIFLSPRIDLSAVINRQIIEGVLAIAKISRSSQYSGKIPLQVFDHSHGVNDVRFNEYSELDIAVAVDVVLRSRGVPSPNASIQPRPLGAQPPSQSQNSTALLGGPNNLANLISALDGPTLQSLLGALQQQQQAPAAAPAPAPAPAPQPYGILNPNPTDLASILANANRTNPPASSLPALNHPGFPSQTQPMQQHNPHFAGDPNLASLLAKGLGGHTQNQPSQHNPQLQNIMGQLSKWRQ